MSAITGIWRAQSDGVIDPFFHWYSWAYMGDFVPVPHISMGELKSDAYFSCHPLVRKNFQGVNGSQITGQDYAELLRLISAKGGDVESLPRSYAPPSPNVGDLKTERDVEVKLLEYYLAKMGFAEERDYRRQIPVRAGRGSRIFPDYALHYDEDPGRESAKILIEAKLEMRNNAQIEECFRQAFSYAKLLESSIIMLCDKNVILLYDKRGGFDRGRYTKIHWGELENPDVFNMLKNKLRK